VESVEAAGKSIEDAILQALVRLGRNRDEVEITVLQEPSRGTRGMGAREARVRVFVKAPRVLHPAGVELDPATDDPLDDEGDGDEFIIEEFADEGEASDAGYETEYVESLSTAPLKDVVADDASIEEVAVAALEMILAHMGVQASVEPAAIETDDEEEPVQLNIRSDDPGTLSLLIGRRGETLSALQLLVSLIVSKQTGNRERILVDAESYRLRREHNLRSMAERIAQQVRRSGNPVTLEAMPPNERRIIHMALSETTDIATESTGEGDQRRVVVSLKRGVRA
jgi:spoIIIJ-associated protein